ncbi:hypothetical protein QC763_408660 [Podospora pseudopauciseta]|uniref:Flavin-nucleotide-binding protein n=1 Tax=Podospora pseudopauciseta TaxID=2093780 RepID=A0ABR0HD21_9PEZI|nr:hypothetical protein QC763_408660 [Podospora pseudopauciseta]
MPRQDLEYPKEAHNTVKRYNHLAEYSLRTIHSIINSTPLLHISFNTPNTPYPATIPMIGQMGSFDRPSADLGDVLDLYIHGYISARLTNLTRTPSGLPITVSASTVDGLLLSLTPFSHGYNFRSAVLFGHATVVTDPAEKLYAMELITNKVVPNRWNEARTPPTAGEMAATAVMKVKIDTGSAKVRTGPPKDDKGDLENEEVREKVWVGTVPVYTVLGEPKVAEYNLAEEVPKTLVEWRKEVNQDAKEYAELAAVKNLAPEKKKQDDN